MAMNAAKNSNKKNNKTGFGLIILAILILFAALIGLKVMNTPESAVDEDVQATSQAESQVETQEETQAETTPVDTRDKPTVTMTLSNGEVVKLALLPEYAPNTVNNFIELINNKFYDGLIFHRIINGFMIQGGDPDGTGMGGPGYSILGEFDANGFENSLSHQPGVISMARSMDYNSAGSQFFIMHGAAPHLDGDYAAFGMVVEGLDVVNTLASVPTDGQDRPLADVVIETMTVDLMGYEPAPVNKITE